MQWQIYNSNNVHMIIPSHLSCVSVLFCMSLSKKSPYSESFWSAFSLHFPAFGVNMQRCSVSLRIQSKCWKMRENCGPEYLRIRTLFTQFVANDCVYTLRKPSKGVILSSKIKSALIKIKKIFLKIVCKISQF